MTRLALPILLLLPALAAAQAPQPRRPADAPARPAAAQPTTPEPERTTASFGDWTLRCEARPEGQGRQCEVVQVLQDQRGQPVAQFAVGRPAPGGTIRLVALLPVNVTVGQPFRLLPEEGQTPIEVALRACGPRGCLADAELDAPVLARLRARDGQGRFEMRDAAGQDLALPLSFRGFAAALAALERG